MDASRAQFDSYFRRYYAEIFRYASGLFGGLAEDIVQETFATLFAHLETIEEDTVRAWLYKVATNKGIDHTRDAKRRADRRQKDAPEAHATPGQQPQTQAFVRLALSRLPPRQAQILQMYSCGLSYEEMAAALDVQASSISQLLLRAKKAFAQHFRALSTQGV